MLTCRASFTLDSKIAGLSQDGRDYEPTVATGTAYSSTLRSSAIWRNAFNAKGCQTQFILPPWTKTAFWEFQFAMDSYDHQVNARRIIEKIRLGVSAVNRVGIWQC